MKAVVAAFNQEKALVGAFSVIVQPVVEPMDRFSALDQAPPFVPQPDSATDTTYFHAKNNIQGLKVSCVDI